MQAPVPQIWGPTDFVEDGAHVCIHSVHADDEAFGNLGVGETLGHQAQHFLSQVPMRIRRPSPTWHGRLMGAISPALRATPQSSCGGWMHPESPGHLIVSC